MDTTPIWVKTYGHPTLIRVSRDCLIKSRNVFLQNKFLQSLLTSGILRHYYLIYWWCKFWQRRDCLQGQSWHRKWQHSLCLFVPVPSADTLRLQGTMNTLIGTSVRRSSRSAFGRSAFGRSTGNDVSGRYKRHYFFFIYFFFFFSLCRLLFS